MNDTQAIDEDPKNQWWLDIIKTYNEECNRGILHSLDWNEKIAALLALRTPPPETVPANVQAHKILYGMWPGTPETPKGAESK